MTKLQLYITIIAMILLTNKAEAVYDVWTRPIYAQENNYQAEVTPEMKAAILKMGPLKNYRITSGGRLEVMQGNRWLELKP